MTQLARTDEQSARQEFTNSDQVLEEPSRYGLPRLSRQDNGWYCSIEMFIQGEGIAFKVDSGFKHAMPFDAAVLCLDRMRTALQDLTAKVM